MLSTGFIGSAYWSTSHLPAPSPVPFGSSLIQPYYGWLNFDDGSSASSSQGFAHRFLLDGIPAWAASYRLVSPLHRLRLLFSKMGDILSPLAPVGEDLSNETHLYGYQVVKVPTDCSVYLTLRLILQYLCRYRFLANESQTKENPSRTI